jgi:hypothetical protein
MALDKPILGMEDRFDGNGMDTHGLNGFSIIRKLGRDAFYFTKTVTGDAAEIPLINVRELAVSRYKRNHEYAMELFYPLHIGKFAI